MFSIIKNVLMGGLFGMPTAPAPSVTEPRRRHVAPPTLTRRAARPAPGDMFRANRYLSKRDIHPARSSSLRKLQRAFRIAGRDFTLCANKMGRV